MVEGPSPPVPLPPAHLERPNLVNLAAGELLHRVHAPQFPGNAFNPCQGGPTRFAPVHDALGVCVPTLYAAQSIEAAIYETILHDVPLGAARKSVPRHAVESRRHSTLVVRRVLRLASLRAPDLMKWGLTPATLIGATPTQYRHTARWAKALHDQFAEVDGLVWTSNLCDPDAALMFFGNRVAPSDLMVASVREGADGSFLQDAHNAAKRANILIAL